MSPSRQPLVIRGDIIDAGDFSNVITCGDTSLELGLTLSFSPKQDLEQVKAITPGAVSVTFKYLPSSEDVVMSRFQINDTDGNKMFHRTRKANGRYSLSKVRGPLKAPDVPRPESRVDEIFRQEISNSLPENFLFRGEDVGREALGRFLRSDSVSTTQAFVPLADSQNYLAVTDYSYGQVTDRLIYKFSYLGPLRQTPLRIYERSGFEPIDVGKDGKSMPELIFRDQKTGFLSELQPWLTHFDLPRSLAAVPVGSSAFSLVAHIDDNNTVVNIADLGFGVSQLLPLIVQALNTSDGRYIVAEQPEIHLNPKLQARLADLFVDVVKRNGGVIVETHSEHLLTRLRRLVAEEKVDSADVAIYFVEHGAGGSQVREMSISTDGSLNPYEWPADFFDQGFSETMELVSAQAKLRRNGG